jgi:hypothetical protein
MMAGTSGAISDYPLAIIGDRPVRAGFGQRVLVTLANTNHLAHHD